MHLRSILGAIEDEEAGQLIGTTFRAMTGRALDTDHWEESLCDHLAANELVYQIVEALDRAVYLDRAGGRTGRAHRASSA